jgi:hypothetical protein
METYFEDGTQVELVQDRSEWNVLVQAPLNKLSLLLDMFLIGHIKGDWTTTTEGSKRTLNLMSPSFFRARKFLFFTAILKYSDTTAFFFFKILSHELNAWGGVTCQLAHAYGWRKVGDLPHSSVIRETQRDSTLAKARNFSRKLLCIKLWLKS